jgi:glyoxylase-like metal-dependent hydrolase (beta-lactamase superfamily II)
MARRRLAALGCLTFVLVAAWFGGAADTDKKPAAWVEVAPGIWRTPRFPAGYALVDGANALLIDAPQDADGLRATGVKTIDGVLLTHHHWDTCAAAEQYLAAKVSVRAPHKSAEWLTQDGVRKHWQDNIPLRHSRAAYFVVPAGLEGIDCSLKDGQEIDWHGWKLQVVDSPGHSRDQVAFLARKGKEGKRVLFCGGALSGPGKMWAPYTTDWDHWTDAGLKPAAESLRKLAGLKPDLLLPAHGPVIATDATAAVTKTAEAVEEAGFLKSFERYTKKRLGNAPEYKFLAKEQAESNGKLPWSQVSKSLFLTGNTYVLTSKDNAFLVIDPWGKLSADQIAKLKADRKLGVLEVVWFSHAHYDHYDGVYHLPDRDRFQVWTAELVARPIAEPLRWYAPFLDVRPVKFERRFKDGATATWREYTFRFHNFPGQTLYTMAVETTIDGKKCLFTADNFFHQDMFSGSGGWMGLNRSFPRVYADSAQKVLDVAPEWVLAEHGGPFEFSQEDFRRRVEWGKAAQTACDALCPCGSGFGDWYPQRIAPDPLVQKAKPGAELRVKLRADNRLERFRRTVTLVGPGLASAETKSIEVPANQETEVADVGFVLAKDIAPGRHVFRLRIDSDTDLDPSDAFVIVDVDKPE